ncbi:MAG: hypothetical protein ACHQFX_08045 [Chitinophagales bacterium]
MENLKLVSIPELIDLLAQQTALYTKMLSSGANHDDFEKCKDKIKQLQKEIELRRQNKDRAS